MSYQRREDRPPPGPPRDIPTAPVLPQRVSGSGAIEQVSAAIREARKAFGRVVKEKVNEFTHSSYADLAAVLEAVDESLEANGLVVLQSTRWEAGELWLDTTILHSSGEWLASVWPLLSDDYRNPQRNGSALTYGRRYVVLMMLGIATVDDDGNASAGRQGPPREQRPARRDDRDERRPARRDDRDERRPAPRDDRDERRREVNRDFPPAERRPEGETRRETWSHWASETLRRANSEWLREMTSEGVEPDVRREFKELSNEPRMVNHLCSRMIEAGRLKEEDITTTNRKGEVVREPRRAREMVVAAFDEFPGKVKSSVARYLLEKRSKLRAELGMVDVDEDLEPAGAETSRRTREPGEDG